MAGFLDQAVVSQVQQANDIVDIVSEHVSLKKKGREMVGLCPFHDDHRPSMYVNSPKQIFKCFACGAGGDVFKFVQMRENLTFPQAVERLAQRVGIKLKPAKNVNARPQRQSQDADPNKLAKVNEWAAQYFQKNLYDSEKGKAARDYIAQRKITRQSAKKWKLGLAVSQDDLIKTAKTQNISNHLLLKAGLVTNQNRDKFVNRLMFPITDVTARIIGFGGRTLEGADAKYINSPTTVLFDKSNSLYGLEQARHQIVSSGTAVVAEGYTDCIMAHQYGCANVVATLGTSFTAGHGRILRRYAKKVVLVFDSDTAGLEAANRALEICLSQRIDIKLASVPEGKDPCDFLLTAGKEPFEQLTEDAVDVFRFKWNRLVENFETDQTLVGNKSAIEEFLQTIATAVWSGNLSAIDRGLIVNRLSRIIGLDGKEINAELCRRIGRIARTASYPDSVGTQNQKTQGINFGQGLFATAQREILEVLLNEPKLFRLVKQKITPDLFDVAILKQTAALLFEIHSTRKSASLAEILAETDSVELGECIVELAQAGEKKGNFQSRLSGALDVVQRWQAQRKTKEINAAEDQTRFLRSVCESTGKRNLHNPGMV